MFRQTKWALFTIVVFAAFLIGGAFARGDIAVALTAVLTVAVALAPFVALGATAYLFAVWLGDPRRPRSWLLLVDVTKAAIVTLAAFFLSWIAWQRFVLPIEARLPGEVAAVILGIAVLELVVVPMIKVAVIWYLRRQHVETKPLDELVAEGSTDPAAYGLASFEELRTTTNGIRTMLRIVMVVLIVNITILSLHVVWTVTVGR